MKRTLLAILMLATLGALPGCGAGDPDQPALGSISVHAKPDFGSKIASKDGKPVMPAK